MTAVYDGRLPNSTRWAGTRLNKIPWLCQYFVLFLFLTKNTFHFERILISHPAFYTVIYWLLSLSTFCAIRESGTHSSRTVGHRDKYSFCCGCSRLFATAYYRIRDQLRSQNFRCCNFLNSCLIIKVSRQFEDSILS